MTIQKPDFNQIFASQAPDVDKPPVFNNYNGGWGDESRPNNGKPTIKGFNCLQQLTDTKLLWLKQNAILPYDSDTDYPVGTVTLKDGKFQKWDGAEWVDFIKPDDSQITTWSGRTQEQKNRDFIFAEDYGAISDGTYHPLSEKFSTLAKAQAKYPLTHATGRLTSLTQSMDWAAIQESVLLNQTTYLMSKKYVVTDMIEPLDGHRLIGQGVDYWDLYRANSAQLLRSDKEGTVIYLYGVGTKNQEITGFANNLIPRVISGTTFEFTHFTNKDSVNGAPATSRKFSCGIKASKNVQLMNFRICPWFGTDGISEYNNTSTTELGAEWDVGVWFYGANDSYCFNIQSVGYYRMAGWLSTGSLGISEYNTFTRRNPERLTLEKCVGQGIRGLLVRNTPQYEVTANTANTVTVKWNNTMQLTAVPRFTVDSTKHTYTGYTFNSADNTVTLTGVTPNISGNIGGIRSPNMDNNSSNTVFKDCFFGGLWHTNGLASSFDLPISAAAEYDGYPVRNFVHINTTFQATGSLEANTLWGNCFNFKYVSCKHEAGYKIAYGQNETALNTMDLRMVAQDNFVNPVENLFEPEYFNPRGAYIDSYMFPLQFPDQTKNIFRPLKGKTLELQDGNSLSGLEITPTVRTLYSANKKTYFQATDSVTSIGVSSFMRFRETTGNTDIVTFYPTAIYPSVTIRPSVDNSIDLGSGAFCFRKTYTTNLSIKSTPIHADNTAAKAASLVAGDVYRTAAGQLMIVY